MPYHTQCQRTQGIHDREPVKSTPQPDIQSAVITNASGVIGLELFGNIGGSNQLDGILLTGKTTSTIYYPHVDNMAGGPASWPITHRRRRVR